MHPCSKFLKSESNCYLNHETGTGYTFPMEKIKVNQFQMLKDKQANLTLL